MSRAINQAGLDLIKKWEGWRSKAYKDIAGVWTIGYGHTSRAGPPVVKPGMQISKATGESMLRKDLRQYEEAVQLSIGHDAPCTDNQFAAMTSLCYNIGPTAFKRSSVAKYMRNREPRTASTRFAPWNKAGGKKVRGLVNRRRDERRLFLTPDGQRMPPDPRDVAGAAGGVVGGTAIIADGVRDGVVNPDLAIIVIIALAISATAFLILRSKKT
jgi:lysozyme